MNFRSDADRNHAGRQVIRNTPFFCFVFFTVRSSSAFDSVRCAVSGGTTLTKEKNDKISAVLVVNCREKATFVTGTVYGSPKQSWIHIFYFLSEISS